LEIYVTLYKELETPIDQDLQRLIDQYYGNYISFWWRILYSLHRVFIWILVVGLIFADPEDPTLESKSGLLVVFIIGFKLVDISKDKYPSILLYVFPICNLGMGIGW